MTSKRIDDIKQHMREKTTAELTDVWVANDRNEWSDEAFEAVRALLVERGVTPPPQDVPPEVQRKREALQEMHQLPAIPVKKAVRIERNFRAWSVLLALWLFFGFFNIFNNFKEANDYRTAVANIKMASSPFVTVKPEFADAVERLEPYVPHFERLTPYFLAAAIIYVPAWIFFFPIRKRFVQRRKTGPKYLLFVLAVIGITHAVGALLTIPIPMLDAMDFLDVFRIRVVPFVIGVIMLTLTPFFGKMADIFYQYTAIDSDCFKKGGIGLDILEQKANKPPGHVR